MYQQDYWCWFFLLSCSLFKHHPGTSCFINLWFYDTALFVAIHAYLIWGQVDYSWHCPSVSTAGQRQRKVYCSNYGFIKMNVAASQHTSSPRGERTAVRGMMPSICCSWKQETRTVGIGCWVSASCQLSRPRQTGEEPSIYNLLVFWDCELSRRMQRT